MPEEKSARAMAGRPRRQLVRQRRDRGGREKPRHVHPVTGNCTLDIALMGKPDGSYTYQGSKRMYGTYMHRTNGRQKLTRRGAAGKGQRRTGRRRKRSLRKRGSSQVRYN